MITTHAEIQTLPFQVCPSVSNLVVHAEEDGPSWVEFVAWYEQDRRYEVIRLTLKRLIGLKVGEWPDVHERENPSIGEIEESPWLRHINALQLENYPNFPDNFKNVHHYFVIGHDEALQFLSEGFTWEAVRPAARIDGEV